MIIEINLMTYIIFFCRILGTPNEEVWPGVTSLQDWNEDFPVWPALNVGRFCNLNETGVDLVEKLLAIDPR